MNYSDGGEPARFMTKYINELYNIDYMHTIDSSCMSLRTYINALSDLKGV
jgi:hypothetical protein